MEDVFYEPMTEGNVPIYVWNKVNSFFFGITLFPRALWKLKLDKVLTSLILKNSDDLIGNSMVAVYTKN